MISRRIVTKIAIAVPIFWAFSAVLYKDGGFFEGLQHSWQRALIFGVLYGAILVAIDMYQGRKS